MRLTKFTCAFAAALAVAACGHHFEPPDKGQQVREAQALYSPALFDSITWASDSVRSFDGNEIYAEKCRRCHGPLGKGGTEYEEKLGLHVPSLVRPVWPLAQVDSLRHRIFVGHTGGMPIYGVAGLSPREIDAVADYILNTLRPDVLGPASRGDE